MNLDIMKAYFGNQFDRIEKIETNIPEFEYLNSNDNLDPNENLDLKEETGEVILSENINMKFLNACNSGDLKKVEEYLTEFKNIVDPAFDNNTAIWLACDNQHISVVKLLLEDERVDPSANDNIALCSAVESKNLDIIRLLLENKRVVDKLDPEILKLLRSNI